MVIELFYNFLNIFYIGNIGYKCIYECKIIFKKSKIYFIDV